MANEKRLIDANSVFVGIPHGKNNDYADGVISVMKVINSLPTVDAVEVVRCKNCKYGEYDFTEFHSYYLCRYIGGDWNKGDHFCSYGERKE